MFGIHKITIMIKHERIMKNVYIFIYHNKVRNLELNETIIRQVKRDILHFVGNKIIVMDTDTSPTFRT